MQICFFIFHNTIGWWINRRIVGKKREQRGTRCILHSPLTLHKVGLAHNVRVSSFAGPLKGSRVIANIIVTTGGGVNVCKRRVKGWLDLIRIIRFRTSPWLRDTEKKILYPYNKNIRITIINNNNKIRTILHLTVYRYCAARKLLFSLSRVRRMINDYDIYIQKILYTRYHYFPRLSKGVFAVFVKRLCAGFRD